jgi:hypothetical protein
MTNMHATGGAPRKKIQRLRRATVVALIGTLSVAGCARILPAGSAGSSDSPAAPATTSSAPATETTVPDLRPPGGLSDAEWAAWALPRLVGLAAVDDGDYRVADLVGLLESGRSRLEVALDLTDMQATSRHTLSTAVRTALPVPGEIAAAHARGDLSTGEAMARIYAADADYDMPRGAFELAWSGLTGETLTDEGWLAISTYVEHGLDPASDVYEWLAVGIDDGKPGALQRSGSGVTIIGASLNDIDHLVNYSDLPLLAELYQLTGSGSIVRAVVIADALTAETVDQFRTKLGPGGISIDIDDAPVSTTTTAPAAPDTAAPATPAAPVDGTPAAQLASGPAASSAPAPVAPSGAVTWHAEGRHWTWTSVQQWQVEVDRGGVQTTTTPEGFRWTGGHRDRGAGWILDVEMGDHVVVDGTRYQAVSEAWVQHGSADAYTDRIGALTGTTTVLQTCGGDSMRLVGLKAVGS